MAILALLPLYSRVTGNTFIADPVHPGAYLAIGAVSLNLIMGYGGMVSFGHAAYLGIGGYAVGILAKEGIGSGFIQWPVAVAASALYALVVGALSLRTRGVYFIMITLAFAQMIYYVAIGLDRYGGDDGLTIYKRSDFGGLIDLNNRTVFYYLCFAVLLASIYLISRLVNSRFGLAIRGTRSNERRMRAIGFPTFRYKLGFRHRRRVVWAGRCAARQPHQLHQPGDHALDALGRSHRHGGAGRPRLAVRAGDRRRDFPPAAGGFVAASPSIPI